MLCIERDREVQVVLFLYSNQIRFTYIAQNHKSLQQWHPLSLDLDNRGRIPRVHGVQNRADRTELFVEKNI